MALADDFRAKAKQNVEGSTALLDAPDFATDPKKQVLAVIGQVNATIYSALADTLEQPSGSAGADPMLALRKSIIEKNNAVRKAAAYGYSTGDWSGFDKLTGTSPDPAEPAADASGTG